MRALIYIMLGLIWNMQVSTETIEGCGDGETKPYFIYSSDIDVEVYFCHDIVDTTDGCEKSGVGATVNNISFVARCASKLYGSRCGGISQSGLHYMCLIAGFEPISFIVCLRTVKFNLQENKFNYPSIDKNKYPHTKMFLGDYKNLELIYTSIGTEIKMHSKKYITSNINNNSVALELRQDIWFSEKLVWTTNIPEIFVTYTHMGGSTYNRTKIFQFQKAFQKTRETIKSACKLDESQPETIVSTKRIGTSTGRPVEDLDLPESAAITKFSSAQDSTPLPSQDQDETIAALRNQLHCAIFVVIICVLWLCITSAFDMYINFLTLRRAARKQANRSRTYIMNCALQSLTNRCLFLNKNAGRGKIGIPLDVTKDADNHNLYESID